MSNRSGSRQISQFTTTQTIPDTAFISYIDTGTNFKIAKSDFLTALGVTGTMEQIGDPLAVPIFVPAGSVNQFRNAEAGPGISTDVSVNNGLLISHDFTQDTVGVPVLINPTADSPTIASIQAGDGMAVSAVDGQIIVSVSGTPISTKTVLISQASDFPSAIGGFIPLADNTDYFIVNDVTVTDKFSVGSAMVLRGPAAGVVTLTCTDTGAMLNGVDKSFSAQNLSISCPNADVFDVSATVPGAVAQLREVQVVSCLSGGTLDGQFISRFDGVSFLNFANSGFLFTGAHQTLIFDQCVTFLNGGTFIDLGTATFNNIIIQNQIIESSAGGTVFLNGLADSGNINVGGLASITNTRIAGSATAVTNIDPVTDIRWESLGNDSIGNSRSDSIIALEANAVETVIASPSTPVPVAGVFTDEGSSRFDVTLSGGRMTFVGERPERLPITMTVSMIAASGGSVQASGHIAINGTVVDATQITTSISAALADTVTLIWQHDFQPTDYVELFLANNSGTVNLIAQSAVLRVD